VFAVVGGKTTGLLEIWHWDGASWTKTNTDNVSDVNVTYINAIWVSSSDVFVVGDYGTILFYDREVPPEPETNANANGNAASTDGPISTATGEFYFSTLDLNLGGPLPLKFGRYYASLLTTGGNVSSSLGNNWMHTFDLSLTVDGSAATVVYYGGKIIEFQNTGSEWELQNSEPTVYQFVEFGPDYHLMDPSNNLIFTFDSTGKFTRIEDRNGNALTLTYTWDQLDEVTDGLGRTLSFTYTGGQLTQVQDDTRRFYHFDEMGTTLFFTDGSGAVTDSYAVTPYGQVAGQTGTTKNPFTFMGAHGVMQEGDSRLYYMRARYYDETTTSFISRDPVKSIYPNKINPYQYVVGNPLRFVDPTGLYDDIKNLYVVEGHLDVFVEVFMNPGGMMAGMIMSSEIRDAAMEEEYDEMKEWRRKKERWDAWLSEKEMQFLKYGLKEEVVEYKPDEGSPVSWGSDECIIQ